MIHFDNLVDREAREFREFSERGIHRQVENDTTKIEDDVFDTVVYHVDKLKVKT
jgi:hypothetical protein